MMVRLDDFGTGILAGFVANGVTALSTHHLDKALVLASQRLEQEEHVQLNYHMILDRLHGDSPMAKEAIYGAASRGLGHFDSDGILHIDIERAYVGLYFENLPLDESSWRAAATVALNHLRNPN